MIEVQLFKFDSKTDYLPYYKKYEIQHDSVTTINDVLKTIFSIEKFEYLSDETFFLRVNTLFTSSDATVESLINDKQELILEPLSIKRAIHDLIIDTKDYKEKLSLLDAYMSEDEKAVIIANKTYMLEYYASNTLHFNNDYIGEHVILLALDIVKKDNTLKDEIFNLLNCEDGISNKSSLKYRIVNYPPKKQITEKVIDSIEQYFDNFNIALYCALAESTFESIITQSRATYVSLQSKHFDIPTNATELSYLMAGTVLLEAKDNNADFLVVSTNEDLALFDAKQKSIGKIMGREIDVPVLTQNEFLQILQGAKKLNKHKVKVPFLGK
ncbi:hypothetical protein JHD48_05070 [Sulfurimonas sp. SAG-AH-194-I05]|nr:hypothetical protein [Sulfurimonas sp. SAG-AH-194-I05]MDF1875097.1 hypothetical protein [Sulfurimonas sp. SAG-AH-194-I05]